MLTEICGYLKNWFNRKVDGTDFPKFKGEITVSGGSITTGDVSLLNGQHFRILGSVLNDGVWEYSSNIQGLKDEVFEGEIWSMAVPSDVLKINDDIEAWMAKYGNIDNPAMSPYNSESFGGYSYTKSAGSNGSAGSSSWKSVFADRLSRYMKL